jgi:hypothetical protein
LTESDMTKAGTLLADAGRGSRLRRLPFVLMLTLGLLLSLLHCAGCGVALAANDTVTVMTASDTGATPDLPDQQLPAHSGHCLSHVAAQACSTIVMPADTSPRAPASRPDQILAALGRLPLFKPPRA